VLERALRSGIQVWTHAIGDRANRLILDLYEETFAKVPPRSAPCPSRAGASSTRST
jgi:predicted amidohydrolase YtcJ